MSQATLQEKDILTLGQHVTAILQNPATPEVLSQKINEAIAELTAGDLYEDRKFIEAVLDFHGREKAEGGAA